MTDEELKEFMGTRHTGQLSMHELDCLMACYKCGMIDETAYNLTMIRHMEAVIGRALDDMSLEEAAKVKGMLV